MSLLVYLESWKVDERRDEQVGEGTAGEEGWIPGTELTASFNVSTHDSQCICTAKVISKGGRSDMADAEGRAEAV